MNFNDKSDTIKYIKNIDNVIDCLDNLYEESDINELQNLINLIKLDDETDFKSVFRNHLLYLINPNEDNTFFDFKKQKNIPILNFVINYAIIQSKKIKISDQDKYIQYTNEKGKSANKNKDYSSKKEIKKSQKIHNKGNSDVKSDIGDSSNESSSMFLSFYKDCSLINESNDTSEIKSEDIKKDSKIKTESQNEKSKKLNIENSTENNLIVNNENITEENKKLLNEHINNDNINNENMNKENKKFNDEKVSFIFKHLFNISTSNNYSLLYNISPNIDKLNSIFGQYDLFTIDSIQMDFQILNIKSIDLLQFLEEIYPGIHNNSKISIGNFHSINDLNELKKSMENSIERFDIIGEIGVNVWNETNKNDQLIKYAKLIYNINYLIKNNANELQYVLDLLNLKSNNKILLMFVSNSEHEIFSKKEKFGVDTLLIYRNKNMMFKISFLENWFKKYEKKGNTNFNKSFLDQFKDIINQPLKSKNYEKVAFKLGEIEKKLKNIKKDLYNYLIKQDNFIEICKGINNSFKSEYKYISFEKFKEIKSKYFNEIIPDSEVILKNNIYIISNQNYEIIKKSFTEKYGNKKLFKYNIFNNIWTNQSIISHIYLY